MAYEAVTTPGSVATFATCSTARSSTALVAISSVANTMPGTRIPGTVPFGTRHTKGSTRSSSTARVWHLRDVEVDVGRPRSVRALLEADQVQRGSLDAHRFQVAVAASGQADRADGSTA